MVKLWTIRCLLVQVPSSDGHSYACGERIWQSSSAIINPRQEMELDGCWCELNWWLTSYPEKMVLRIWGFWKDGKLSFDRWSVLFCNLFKVDQFESRPTEMSWDLRHHKMRRVVGQYSMVSIGFYDSYLFPQVCCVVRYTNMAMCEMGEIDIEFWLR